MLYEGNPGNDAFKHRHDGHVKTGRLKERALLGWLRAALLLHNMWLIRALCTARLKAHLADHGLCRS